MRHREKRGTHCRGGRAHGPCRRASLPGPGALPAPCRRASLNHAHRLSTTLTTARRLSSMAPRLGDDRKALSPERAKPREAFLRGVLPSSVRAALGEHYLPAEPAAGPSYLYLPQGGPWRSPGAKRKRCVLEERGAR